MLRRVERPARFDRFPVTVGRYRRFLEAVADQGPGQWAYPATPAGHSYQPWRERLRVLDYYDDHAYDDPAYDEHPAIAVNWWSAYGFARFEGKRLPPRWSGRLPRAAPTGGCSRGVTRWIWPW